MYDTNARSLVSGWASEDVRFDFQQKQPPRTKVQREIYFDNFKKRYGIAILVVFAWAVSLMVGCIITGVIVMNNTTAKLTAQYEHDLDAAIKAYEAEQATAKQKEYFLSGEASREAQINQDADELAKAMGIWKTNRAKGTFVWNVLMRVASPLYPGSVKEVLEQPGQYEFYSSSNMINEADRELARKILNVFYSGVIPQDLTVNHLYLEMRENGNDCVLHTSYNGKGSDNTWRWTEQ